LFDRLLEIHEVMTQHGVTFSVTKTPCFEQVSCLRRGGRHL